MRSARPRIPGVAVGLVAAITLGALGWAFQPALAGMYPTHAGRVQELEARFTALDATLQDCGQFATEVRIYPCHELLSHPYELGLMKWL